MRTNLGLTKEELDELLAWLHPNPDCAGERYEAIRKSLITLFLTRQCYEAEDLADETINRVAKKVKELKSNYAGEPARYFHGVAKKVSLEYHRRNVKLIETPAAAPSREELEPYLDCLDDCLSKLKPRERETILDYYQEQKQVKIERHKEMGQRLQVKSGALRGRVFRIRVKLHKCIVDCIQRSVERNNIGPEVI